MQSETQSTFDTYYGSFWGGKIFRWIDIWKLNMIKKLLAKKKRPLRLLDWGCGAAAISSQLISWDRNLKISGIDHNIILLDSAKKRGLDAKQWNFNEPIPFANGHFDVVLMVDTIEHLEFPHGALSEVKRVLTDEGTLVVFTPPYDSFSWLFGEMFFKWVTGRETGHISPFTRESLLWLMKKNFQDCWISQINFGLTLSAIAQNKKIEFIQNE